MQSGHQDSRFSKDHQPKFPIEHTDTKFLIQFMTCYNPELFHTGPYQITDQSKEPKGLTRKKRLLQL